MTTKPWNINLDADKPGAPPRIVKVDANNLDEAWTIAKYQEMAENHPREPSLKGALDAVSRGLAPVVAGGAMGMPFGPAGAAAGVITTGLEELGGTAYNALAPHIGLPHYTTFGEVINKGLDKYGTLRPGNDFERVLEATAGGATSASGMAKALETYGAKMAPSVTKNVIGVMGNQPVRQGASGALAGGVSQEAVNQGADPLTATALGVVGGAAPFINRGSGALDYAKAANERGYTIHPSSASERPSWMANLINMVSGDVTSTREMTFANQANGQKAIKQDLRIPDNVKISNRELERVRSNEGSVYAEVEQLPGTRPDAKFIVGINTISGPLGNLKSKFPSMAKNSEFSDLKADFSRLIRSSGPKGTLTSKEAVTLSRVLRQRAAKNIMSEIPATEDLGHIQKEVADVLEEMLSRRAGYAKKPDLMDKWQDARTRISQSHYVEGALNPSTGNIDFVQLGRVAKKKSGLFTGGLGQAASTGSAFKDVMGLPEDAAIPQKMDARSLLYTLPMSTYFIPGSSLPIAAAATAAAAAAPKLARALAHSKIYQRALASSPEKSLSADALKALAAKAQAVPYQKKQN